MGKTKIEWCDYTINPVKGLCPVGCSYCYARRMYKRFKWDKTIREDVTVYDQLDKMKAGSRVFIGSTIELFGDWVTPLMRSNIYHVCEMYPDLTFIFLTKRPQDLPKAFDDNCWVGVSATDYQSYMQASFKLLDIKARVKFLSFEPLLDEAVSERNPINGICGINWLIIGQQTPVSAKTTPKVEWVQEIVQAADKAGVPVFLKNNLDKMIPHHCQDNVLGNLFRNANESLRQEFPHKGG